MLFSKECIIFATLETIKRQAIMKKRLSSFAMMLLVTAVAMVAQTRYCLSYEDFKNDKWVTLEDSVKATMKNTNGIKGLVFATGNKELDKLLKKEARFIVYRNTLFINNRKLKGKGISLGKNYTPALRYGKDSICIAGPRGLKGGKAALYFTGTSVIVAPTREDDPVCYIMKSDERKLPMITTEYMNQLLADKPQLKSLYEAEDKKKSETAEVVMKYLLKLDLLKPY